MFLDKQKNNLNKFRKESDMAVKVSVIVPVYNASKTLSACLGNLVHQTLTEIELILVNDASTDQSLNILLECEQAFSDKVIIVNLEHNSGPGGARNAGLCYASGEYIGFVDSDDIPDIHMYERLYKLAVAGNYDMADGAYYNENTDTLILQTADHCSGILDADKRSDLIAGGGYLWSRIFRRELFSDLQFRENTILEDMETLMLLFMRTKKLGTTREFVYKYCAANASASKLSDPTRYQKAIVDAMRAIASTLLPLDDYEGVQTAVEYSLLHLYLCGIVNAIHPDHSLPDMVQHAYLSELKQLRSQYVKLPYKDNQYVHQKFSENDLQIIRKIDMQI